MLPNPSIVLLTLYNLP
ncbi:uncharacterized protein FFC1_10894 [Fusarium fujikuroi]|nr:uncharacterized protein FFC1_10894 [Fusarium fujikuroi]